MSCGDCGPSTQGVCDCCRLVNGDTTFKEVVFCEDCNAWICKACDGNLIKRGMAYGLDKFQKIKQAIKDCCG